MGNDASGRASRHKLIGVNGMALSEDERRIVEWLRACYTDAAERQSMPVNAISMIDTIRKLIEEEAHRP